MTKKDTYTDEEFIEIVAVKGGVVLALEYGLTADSLKDQDGVLAFLWRRAEKKYAKLIEAEFAIELVFEIPEY